MPKRRTLAERAKYRSADEAAVALGMHPRSLKRRVREGNITAPAMFQSEGRYLFTDEELDRLRDELGVAPPDRSTELERFLRDATAAGWKADTAVDPSFDQFARVLKRLNSDVAAKQAYAPSFLLDPNVLAFAKSVQGTAEFAKQLDSTSRFWQTLRERSDFATELEVVREAFEADVPVAAGQVQAFPEDRPMHDAEPTLREVLAELNETNRMLRALLRQQGITAVPGGADEDDDGHRGLRTSRQHVTPNLPRDRQ